MSRTYLIEHNSNDTALFSSNQHEQLTAVERAMREGHVVDSLTQTKFQFDLIDFVKAIQVKRLKDAVAGRLTFSIDGYIQGALSRMLNDFYKHSRADEAAPTFKSYADFLAHIEGLSASEQSLYETGLEVTPSVERIRNLVGFRNELHTLIAGDPDLVRSRYEKVGSGEYMMPTVRDMLSSPRMRTLSAADEEQLRLICEDDYPNDAEMRKELFEQYKLDTHIKLLTDHKFAKDKAQSLIVLWSCVGADDEAAVTDEDDAFFTMDTQTQRGLLRSTLRVITDTRKEAVLDNRLSTLEKASLRVEAKALIAALTVHIDHVVFSNLPN